MEELIQRAKLLIDRHYSPYHQVAAILQASDGRYFEGVSVQGQKLHLCSEWTALTQSLMAGAHIVMAVAVFKNKDGGYEVFPPCAICRELYVTYCPNAQIVVSETEMVEACQLLPHMWVRRK